jgi:hypothetical protein
MDGLRWSSLPLFLWLASCSGSIGDSSESGSAGTAAGTSNAGSSGTAGSGGALSCSEPSVAPSPLRRLTHEQYDNTVRDLLGIEGNPSGAITPDEKVAAFYSNAISPVDRLVVEQYAAVAESLARQALSDIDGLVACDRTALGDAACASRFIARFGARAYRRPLSETEQQRFEQLYTTYAAEFADGIRLVVTAMLQSPSFVYHLELTPAAPDSAGAVALNDYELASRLSYALWNSMPDESLFSAAAAGRLGSAEGLRSEAERLLGDARSGDAFASFHVQWLGLETLPDTQKDPALFPEFSASMKAAMTRETVRFADYVLRRGDGRLETLLTAPFSLLEEPLHALYGVAPAATAEEPVGLDPARRAGLLTQAAFLTAHAHPYQSSLVRRGHAIRKNLLCTTLPDPPDDVNNNPPDPAPGATTRERFAEHTSETSCASCHALIDPIGFGFENYDAIGRYRDQENGLDVDASGELTHAGTTSGPFTGAVELAHKLATSDQVRDCVARQWFRFSLGRLERTQDACTLERLKDEFGASDYDVRRLLLAIVTSDAFRYRPGAAP